MDGPRKLVEIDVNPEQHTVVLQSNFDRAHDHLVFHEQPLHVSFLLRGVMAHEVVFVQVLYRESLRSPLSH